MDDVEGLRSFPEWPGSGAISRPPNRTQTRAERRTGCQTVDLATFPPVQAGPFRAPPPSCEPPIPWQWPWERKGWSQGTVSSAFPAPFPPWVAQSSSTVIIGQPTLVFFFTKSTLSLPLIDLGGFRRSRCGGRWSIRKDGSIAWKAGRWHGDFCWLICGQAWITLGFIPHLTALFQPSIAAWVGSRCLPAVVEGIVP